MRSTGEPTPIACSLTAAQLEDRRDAWEHVVQHWGVDRRRQPDRIRLRFAPAPGVLASLRRLVELEAECCPWMTFDLVEDDPVVLDITAEGEGLAAAAIMFEAGP